MKGFLKRLGIACGVAAMFGVFATAFYYILKIPHIEEDGVAIMLHAIIFVIFYICTFVFCCFFWLFTGKWIFPDWMSSI